MYDDFILFLALMYNPILSDLKPGLISQANGSAYIETAKTKIACAVFVGSSLDSSYFTKWA